MTINDFSRFVCGKDRYSAFLASNMAASAPRSLASTDSWFDYPQSVKHA
jgi:hypothetical protein